MSLTGSVRDFAHFKFKTKMSNVNRAFTLIHRLRSGFTLIELLVVISVIGLLASVVLISINSVRVKARNAKRLSDIRQLITAFNLAIDASSSGWAPDLAGADACIATSCGGGPWDGITANPAIDAFLAPYVKKPADAQDNIRGYWGILYDDNYSGTAPYDGYVLTGSYLDWTMEGTATPDSCSPGRVWYAPSGWFECVFKLD